MPRHTSVLFAFLLCLAAPGLSGQVFLDEDFSTASSLNPPSGWTTSTSGTVVAPWRWDNPGLRGFATPTMIAPFAISDSDNAGISALGTSIMVSPTMNVGTGSPLNLSFDQQFRDLTSGWSIEVWDGNVWNTVASQANNTTNLDIGYGMTPDVVHSTYDITAAAAGAANAQVRWTYSYGYDWWWAIDNVQVEHPLAVDLRMISIDAPVNDPTSCTPVTGSLPLSVTFENRGTVPLPAGTFIQIQFDVSGGTPVIEFISLANPMNYLDTLNYTFLAPVTLALPGPNDINVSILLVGDLEPGNDTISGNFDGVGLSAMVANYPYLQTFDSLTATAPTQPPVGWRQDTVDGTGNFADWLFSDTGTPSGGTGPTTDHGTGSGFFAYVEDDGSQTSVALVSPCFDLSIVISPQLRFWLHSNNASTPTTSFQNFLSVDVIAYPGGAVTTDVLGPLGHQGSSWVQQSVSLAPFIGQTIQLVFRGQSSGGSNTHDIAIDDVAVFDPLPTPGQPSQLGLAEFDINFALNPNAEPVYSGAGGPYYASVVPGGFLDMSIRGEANKAIVMLTGPLNPGAASYPGIGQFDIGGAVTASGIPSSIFVLADGFNAQSLLNAFFNTGPSGTVYLGFQVPNFPAGPLATLQTIVATSAGPFIAMSNSVHVTVN